MMHRGAIAILGLLLAAVSLGCQGGKTELSYPPALPGDPDSGARVIREKGCGACHVIPGIRSARGEVGPPLDTISRRTFIAGELPNSAENLVRWIRAPHEVDRTTAMPDLGLTEREAQDVAAYLYRIDEEDR